MKTCSIGEGFRSRRRRHGPPSDGADAMPTRQYSIGSFCVLALPYSAYHSEPTR
jgi:hypothetical protein